jgi:hypothetical protein
LIGQDAKFHQALLSLIVNTRISPELETKHPIGGRIAIVGKIQHAVVVAVCDVETATAVRRDRRRLVCNQGTIQGDRFSRCQQYARS